MTGEFSFLLKMGKVVYMSEQPYVKGYLPITPACLPAAEHTDHLAAKILPLHSKRRSIRSTLPHDPTTYRWPCQTMLLAGRL